MASLLTKRARLWMGLLALGDFVMLVIALHAAEWLRFGSLDELSGMPMRTAVFALTLMLGLAAMGQYQSYMRARWVGVLTRQLLGFVLGGIGLVVLYYLIPQAYVGRGVLAIAWVLGFLAVRLFRAVFLRVVEVENLKRRVLILGAGERAALIEQRMRRRSDRRGVKVLGFVPVPDEPVRLADDLLVRPDGTLDAWAQAHRVNEIVVGVDNRRGSLRMAELLQCRQLGIDVSDLTTFFERETGRVELSLLHPSWLVYSDGFYGPFHRFAKRGMDLALASLVAIVVWPLMLLVALAIRIESGAGQPILYHQERTGMRGQPFKLVKFRSMRTDAERGGVAQWAAADDDRVTRVGRFIRKVRLDELPQLWNILKGDMSIVGPRPERPEFVAELSKTIPYYEVRHCLKPGLAGWAQLRYAYGASEKDAAEKLQYDLYYVKNHSLLLDLMILIETVEVVLFGRGAR